MRTAKINMSKLNKEYRKYTGVKSMSGISLPQKMAVLFQNVGAAPPHTKQEKIELANMILAGKYKKQTQEKTVRKRTEPAAPKSKSFYASWEWKKVRYEALKIHGQRCQCCGWRPGDTEYGHLVVDHIQPRSKRPDLALTVENLQILCNDCNMGKSNIHVDDFRDREDWFAAMMKD